MNIEKFIAARKAKGLSQQDVAKGICTQATVSRFERNGQIPSLKILTQLCERVGIEFDSIFPSIHIKRDEKEHLLEKIEYQLIILEYHKGFQNLKELETKDLTSDQRLHYLYLKGFLTVLLHLDLKEASFSFEEILTLEKENDSSLYRLLAQTGLGLVARENGDKEKGNRFFEEIIQSIQKVTPENTADIWKVLTILFYLGKAYSQDEHYELSNSLLKKAVHICQDNHVTYYVARIFLQLALNAIDMKEEKEKISEYLEDAWSFSKFNRNRNELEILIHLKEEYQKK